MRAPISVVIPTLNAEQGLSKSLLALVEGLETGLIREVIVVDGGSQDQTPAFAEAWGAEVIEAPPSRGGQIAKGCAAARGDWVFVLHADSVLEPGWSAPFTRHMQTGKAGWCHLRFDTTGAAPGLVAAWANLRSRLGLPYGDQGLLIARDQLAGIGGYPDQPLMEDVSIARRLKGQLAPIGATIVTSADRFQAGGWVRQGARNLWTLTRYALGAKPETLASAYNKRRPLPK